MCGYKGHGINMCLSMLDHIADCVRKLDCWQGICCLASPLNVEFHVEHSGAMPMPLIGNTAAPP